MSERKETIRCVAVFFFFLSVKKVCSIAIVSSTLLLCYCYDSILKVTLLFGSYIVVVGKSSWSWFGVFLSSIGNLSPPSATFHSSFHAAALFTLTMRVSTRARPAAVFGCMIVKHCESLGVNHRALMDTLSRGCR